MSPPARVDALATTDPSPAEPDPLLAHRVVPLRRPGRWLATAVVLVVLAQVVNGVVTDPSHQSDRSGHWFFRPVVLEGLLITLQVTPWSAVLAPAAAIDHLVGTGRSATRLEAWNLSDEAVDASAVDPPGLPLSNS